ncbi:MAG TPA: hypothetical protein VLM11_06910 [Streptosporangiaceae bacterium]|nr:hypothetical protein [Streptosporangiaceae bacterium]
MRDYVLTLLVTAAVTYILTPLVRRMASRIGAIKEPRDRDVHTAPVPTIGGLAMYGGLAAGLLVADQIKPLRDGFANTGMVSGLLLAGGLLVVVGILDDRWGLSPLTKAAGQVAAGGILVATGTQLNWLPLPGGQTFLPTSDQSTVLTILIVVATINAVNFIDGLDGLAAGIVAIAAVSFFLYYYSMTKIIDISRLAAPALASAVLIGMCIGFLPHNFSPAKIFMGDTGSMLLGLLLAYAPISSIPSLDPAVLASHINRYPVILPLLLPAALLVIPYGDLLLAVVRRTRAGQSPFSPDRKHLHHRLLDIGHSQRSSVLIMYLWAAVFSGSVVWLSLQRTQQPGGGNTGNHHGHPVFVFIAITAAAVVVLLLMSMPKLRQWGKGTGLDEARAGVNGAGSGPAGVPAPAHARASAGVPAGTAELQPPDAAPLAAIGAVEPQLVAAAAVSRMAPLSAPTTQNGGLPERLRPAPDRTGRDWTDPDWRNPDGGSRGEAANGWTTHSGHVGSHAAGPEGSRRDHWAPDHAAPPTRPSATSPEGDGPSSATWRFGDGWHSDRPPSGSAPAGNAGAGNLSARDGGSGVRPGNGHHGRSIIGTPPPAITSLGAQAGPVADSEDLERRERRDTDPEEL